jgi:hypothetical protein
VGTPTSLTKAEVTLGWDAAKNSDSQVLPNILRHNIYLSRSNDPNVYLYDSVNQVHNADPSRPILAMIRTAQLNAVLSTTGKIEEVWITVRRLSGGDPKILG